MPNICVEFGEVARGLAARMKTPPPYLFKDLRARGSDDESALSVPCHVATCVFDVPEWDNVPRFPTCRDPGALTRPALAGRLVNRWRDRATVVETLPAVDRCFDSDDNNRWPFLPSARRSFWSRVISHARAEEPRVHTDRYPRCTAGADSERCRSRFRSDADQRSEPKPITSMAVVRNADRHGIGAARRAAVAVAGSTRKWSTPICHKRG